MALQANREILRAIDGYDNYEASNHGRIRNVNTARILKPSNNGTGYRFVRLSTDRKIKQNYVHRLVASAFLENPNELPEVDHLDSIRNRSNNTASNLRWCTKRQNARNQDIPKNNKSGTKGIHYRSNKKQWIAGWCDGAGKPKSKSFSTNKYENAKELAIAYRKQMEEENGYL